MAQWRPYPPVTSWDLHQDTPKSNTGWQGWHWEFDPIILSSCMYCRSHVEESKNTWSHKPTWRSDFFPPCCVTLDTHLTSLGFSFLFWKGAVLLLWRILGGIIHIVFYVDGTLWSTTPREWCKAVAWQLGWKQKLSYLPHSLILNSMKPCIRNHFVRNKQCKLSAVVTAIWWMRMDDIQTCIFLCNSGEEFLGFVWSLWDIALISRGRAAEVMCA